MFKKGGGRAKDKKRMWRYNKKGTKRIAKSTAPAQKRTAASSFTSPPHTQRA